jgi:hypothetical protein
MSRIWRALFGLGSQAILTWTVSVDPHLAVRELWACT